MGFEYATRRPFDTALASRDDMDIARAMAPVDLSEDIIQANALVDRIAALGVDGPLRVLTEAPNTATAWLRTDTADARTAGTAILIWINLDLARSAEPPFPPDVLPPSAGAAFGFAAPVEIPGDPAAPLAPGEVRVLSYSRQTEIHAAAEQPAPRRETAAATRIAIESVAPAPPDGDFPAKTVVGEAVEVSADIYADGHEMLAADVLWRAADETVWRREPMRKGLNDRWTAAIRPARIGRHLFTVEAWWDQWGTFRHDLDVKHAAGQAVDLEIEEGRQHIGVAIERAAGADLELLRSLLDRLEAEDEATQVSLLLSEDALAAIQAGDVHPFHNRHAPPLPLWVDRPQAMFANWYEMFPRSATGDPNRHGTFRDVTARLPAIHAMGFDVLYFPPIHPIGSVNRKGRNNALRAEPGDFGSPYAIGSADGGHDAVHPQLGTIEDFDALVAAARDHGLEVALDFAIQCAPDHPWITQHPDWFRWRPDGSMRYAENPPKKYEDIVNPDFYAEAAMPDLWFALRDVIRFWIGHGVRIFRVDNPHTKPLPFWRWMIADIQAQFPDVLFLSEAFTRPKVMYRLAKVGFTQSYTYFTWRNTKQELTEYLTELSTPPVCDYFRPNFFVNTPDINPVYLQTSGRPGFLVRAALAATLSGLWGVYSGFEICESAPLPGREEYLDSEKYQIRVRDWHAPGNIVAEITALNRIRRAHPALQTHKGVTFYPAANGQILFYGKQLPGGHEIVLVAVNLDPHHPQEAAIEIPLWKLGLPDHAAIEVVDLMRETRFTWHGKWQTVRLDPADMPFAIWRLSAPGAA
jgi:starch synthase (maltosyl-transferring)